ncbi:hypothetical protein F4778DRAFT_123500 [Xylariomycetidae sp. FL2044]|nr:hypothetical protein F4778DRAFT_123500 [Xylariomycetidae sp. FL2044]
MSHHTGGRIISLQTPSPSPDGVLTGKYRRNGKLQSCEPCRKSKLKCDHLVPSCRRCVRRGIVDKCVYHPNPLTQSRKPRQRTPLTSSASSHNERTSEVLPSVEGHAEKYRDPPLEAGPSRSTVTLQRPHRAASAPPLNTCQWPGPGEVRVDPGFQGVTSYLSIFSENLGKLGVVSSDLEAAELPRVWVSESRMSQGCQCLAFLKNSTMVIQFVSRWFEIGEGGGVACPDWAMREWLKQLLGIHYGETLKEQNPERIRQLCHTLWRNTSTQPVCDKGMTAMQWVKSCSGPNIRWEVIAMIAAIVGQCAITLDPMDPLLQEYNIDRPSFPRRMAEIARSCLDFCHECDTLGDLLIWALSENFFFLAYLRGEGSHAAYRASGELITAVVAMGLHIDIKLGKPTIPFLLEEMRKRALLNAYSQEISTSSFLGRPTRLMHRYCNIIQPLDLSDHQLSLEGDELAAAIASLDSNGFNTSGKITRASWLKAWGSFALQREDVLDLALYPYSREELLRRAEIITDKAEAYWASLPPFIRRVRDGTPESCKRTPLEKLSQVAMLQAYRVNELLLQRVLIRKAGATSGRLLEIARLIFQDVLHFSHRQDLGSAFSNEITAVTAIQGLRSAAVIAVELLKQEQLPTHPSKPLLPRSQTIQDLSVFAARLGAVDRSSGLFSMCDQGRKVITRILDSILDKPSAASQPNHIRSPQAQQPQGFDPGQPGPFTPRTAHHESWHMPDPTEFVMDDLDFGIDAPFLGPDSDFMQWLESVDWERPT